MLEDLGSGQTGHFIVAFAVVGLGLLALFAVMWFIRGRSNSTFIRGGKNRQPRLAVLDAAPVDTRRRLVLVRRDSVEHLILIGGPTDVVIESGIAADAFEIADSLHPQPSAAPSMPHAARSENPPREAAPVREAATPAAASANVRPMRETETTSEKVAAKPAPAPAPVRPAEPVPTPAASQPVTARPVNIQSVAVEPSSARDPGARTVRPAAAVASASVTRKPEPEDALDALDAARDRVLSSVEPEPASSAEGPQAAYYEFEPIAEQAASNTPRQSAPLVATARTVAPFPATQVRQAPRQEPARTDPVSDFESILEAELSGDMTMDDDLVPERDIAVIGVADTRTNTTTISREGDLSGVSATGGTTSRAAGPRDDDTLEDEMDKLLGDLTRRG